MIIGICLIILGLFLIFLAYSISNVKFVIQNINIEVILYIGVLILGIGLGALLVAILMPI